MEEPLRACCTGTRLRRVTLTGPASVRPRRASHTLAGVVCSTARECGWSKTPSKCYGSPVCAFGAPQVSGFVVTRAHTLCVTTGTGTPREGGTARSAHAYSPESRDHLPHHICVIQGEPLFGLAYLPARVSGNDRGAMPSGRRAASRGCRATLQILREYVAKNQGAATTRQCHSPGNRSAAGQSTSEE